MLWSNKIHYILAQKKGGSHLPNLHLVNTLSFYNLYVVFYITKAPYPDECGIGFQHRPSDEQRQGQSR